MGKKKCRCGGKLFETIDITPCGMTEKQYFTRCVKCGLVVAAPRADTQGTDSPKSIRHFFRALGTTR